MTDNQFREALCDHAYRILDELISEINEGGMKTAEEAIEAIEAKKKELSLTAMI